MTALRSFAGWLLIILAETVHGILRAIFLVPLTGDLRARQIGVIIGSLIIFAITYVVISWLRVSTLFSLIAVGAFWVALTVLFEVALGRLIIGTSWDRILSDYNIVDGGFMIFGLLFMFFAPYLAFRMKRSQAASS